MTPSDRLNDTDLIVIHAETTFIIWAAGRIQSESKPDLSCGPRFILAGCKSGNVFHVHRNVDNATAHSLESLTADEPPLFDVHGSPSYLEKYVALLSATEEQVGQGLNHVFPFAFTYDH